MVGINVEPLYLLTTAFIFEYRKLSSFNLIFKDSINFYFFFRRNGIFLLGKWRIPGDNKTTLDDGMSIVNIFNKHN